MKSLEKRPASFRVSMFLLQPDRNRNIRRVIRLRGHHIPCEPRTVGHHRDRMIYRAISGYSRVGKRGAAVTLKINVSPFALIEIESGPTLVMVPDSGDALNPLICPDSVMVPENWIYSTADTLPKV